MKLKLIAFAAVLATVILGSCAHKTCPTYSKECAKNVKTVRI
jgi:outer membrane lipoprotein SlyB